ncbi:MAG TPA: hypothetical protein PLO14_00760, partial [Accumulibacter sp.]|nr:hypothetical protein [Accumulibacter sp.]
GVIDTQGYGKVWSNSDDSKVCQESLRKNLSFGGPGVRRDKQNDVYVFPSQLVTCVPSGGRSAQ